MAVFLKNGKYSVKKYDIYPDELVYLKVGDYLLAVRENKLMPTKELMIPSIDLSNLNVEDFYSGLKIDKSEDEFIDISLNRKGNSQDLVGNVDTQILILYLMYNKEDLK